QSQIGFIHGGKLLAPASRSLLRKRGIFECPVGVRARYLLRDKRLRPCQGKPAEKMISFIKLWAWDEENLPSMTHAIPTAVATSVSVIIARLVQMPEAYWAAIATLLVMQSTLGAPLT